MPVYFGAGFLGGDSRYLSLVGILLGGLRIS